MAFRSPNPGSRAYNALTGPWTATWFLAYVEAEPHLEGHSELLREVGLVSAPGKHEVVALLVEYRSLVPGLGVEPEKAPR